MCSWLLSRRPRVQGVRLQLAPPRIAQRKLASTQLPLYAAEIRAPHVSTYVEIMDVAVPQADLLPQPPPPTHPTLQGPNAPLEYMFLVRNFKYNAHMMGSILEVDSGSFFCMFYGSEKPYQKHPWDYDGRRCEHHDMNLSRIRHQAAEHDRHMDQYCRPA